MTSDLRSPISDDNRDSRILAQSPKFFFDFDYMVPVLESPADFDGKKCSEVVFTVFDVFSVNTIEHRGILRNLMSGRKASFCDLNLTLRCVNSISIKIGNIFYVL